MGTLKNVSSCINLNNVIQKSEHSKKYKRGLKWLKVYTIKNNCTTHFIIIIIIIKFHRNGSTLHLKTCRREQR